MPLDFCISRHFPGRKIPGAYNFEANRIASFVNCNCPVSPFRLAKAGFVYKGQGDLVECCFCEVTHSQWEPGENPLETHERKSPNCSLFTESPVRAAVGPNIPIPTPSPKSCRKESALLVKEYLDIQGAKCSGVEETGLQESKDNCITPPLHVPGVVRRYERRRIARANSFSNIKVPNMIDGQPAYSASACEEEGEESAEMQKYPDFSTHEKREKTYDHFPSDRRGLVERLLLQGFFFTGHQDIVICYYCGLGLYQWLAGDDPVIAHARWSRNCRHLHNVVSSAFMEAIRRELERVGSASAQ